MYRSAIQTTCSVMGGVGEEAVIIQRKHGGYCERRKWVLDGQPQYTQTRNLCNKILKVLSLISYQRNISKIT